MSDTKQAQTPVHLLSDFMVSERPLASERKAKWKQTTTPWWKNAKLRHAAEQLGSKTHTKYVEDGDLYYKVRLKAWRPSASR